MRMMMLVLMRLVLMLMFVPANDEHDAFLFRRQHKKIGLGQRHWTKRRRIMPKRGTGAPIGDTMAYCWWVGLVVVYVLSYRNMSASLTRVVSERSESLLFRIRLSELIEFAVSLVCSSSVLQKHVTMA